MSTVPPIDSLSTPRGLAPLPRPKSAKSVLVPTAAAAKAFITPEDALAIARATDEHELMPLPPFAVASAKASNESWRDSERLTFRSGASDGFDARDVATHCALAFAWAVAPVAIAVAIAKHVLTLGTKRERAVKRTVLASVVGACELGWFAYRSDVRDKYCKAPNKAIATPTSEDFARFLQLRHDGLPDFGKFLRGWMKRCNSWTEREKARAEDTAPESSDGGSFPRESRESALKFLRFGFHDVESAEEMPKAKEHALNAFVDEIERTWEYKLERSSSDDSNSSEGFMFHTKEGLGAMHQPLAFTAWVHGVGGTCAAVLRLWGFKRYTASNGCSYWINTPLTARDWKNGDSMISGDEDERPFLNGAGIDDVSDDVAKPIVFVHGLGVGLAPYLPNIAQLLRSKPGRKIALLTLPHISMRATPKVPEIDVMVDTIVELTMKHKLRAPCLYAHSFGTFVIARTCHRYRVSSVALLDPVAICLCLPKTVSILYHLGNCWSSFKSFVRKNGPKAMLTTTFWSDGGEVLYYLLRDYFLVREIGVMTALRRQFWWATHNLWADQIPDNSLIILEAHDMLIDCEAVAKHVLRQSNARVIWQDNFSHGMFMSPWGFSLRSEVANFLDALPTTD